ncbi:PAS domain-containing hybrid sensor histidine kinase/response regulator [Salidesulfovibrio brasiliensis]|uniref:PAS domain-containing hybrid sensor histidine kinase/response regulator n=1 Tax=Salidesulfovibrio brasiliensis TaxID=221711 RepID=UPI000AE985A3|nr:ATP-binding protein [Salidesulfovibrio brasiliensis]
MAERDSFVLVGGSQFLSRARRVVEECGGSVEAELDAPDAAGTADACLLVDATAARSILASAGKLGPTVALARSWDAACRAMEVGTHDACLEDEAETDLARAAWRARRHFSEQDACRDMAEAQRIVAGISPFCFWKLDSEHESLTGPDGICDLFGLAPGMPMTLSAMRRLVHPDDLPLLDAGIRRAQRRGKPLDTEFRCTLPNGEGRHIRVCAEPWSRGSETRPGLRGVFIDVTGNKEAELRVERSHTQLLEAQSVARIGSWEMDESGAVEWSGGLMNILGCDENEMLNGFDSLRRFVHPEDREIFDQANRATMEGWPLDFEYRVITASGELRHLQLHSRVELDGGGKVARAYGIARDISSQKRFEQALEKRDAILQAVSGAAGRFLRETGWEEEIGHIIENLGRSAGADTAYVVRNTVGSDGELLGSLVHEWSAPGLVPLISLPELQEVQYHPRFSRWVERLRAGKAIVGPVNNMPQGEREFMEAIGVKSLIAVPVATGDGLWGIMGLLSRQEEREWLGVEVEALHMAGDIFGSAVMRGRMEDALLHANLEAEEAKVEAEEASKAKSRFLANMSHEIRTPISGIIGLTEMTITTGLKPDQRQNLDMIRDAARSLLNIINDVLDLSKIEADKMRLQQEDFDLRKSVERTVKPFEAQAVQKGIELDLIIDDDVPRFLHGDHERLGQILRNLVSNATKFTEQGHVEVLVENGSTRGEASSVRFKVSDSGIGIPEEQIETIFDSFTQVDSSRGKRHQGTGLGLAICRELTEMMGGTISVRSRVGRGSTFTFEVWFGPADSIQPADDGDQSGLPSAFNLKILMAEDNPLNQKFLTHFLTMFGHEVRVANNGLEALEMLRRSRPPFDLVLMDIQMPEMDGMETTKQSVRPMADSSARTSRSSPSPRTP